MNCCCCVIIVYRVDRSLSVCVCTLASSSSHTLSSLVSLGRTMSIRSSSSHCATSWTAHNKTQSTQQQQQSQNNNSAVAACSEPLSPPGGALSFSLLSAPVRPSWAVARGAPAAQPRSPSPGGRATNQVRRFSGPHRRHSQTVHTHFRRWSWCSASATAPPSASATPPGPSGTPLVETPQSHRCRWTPLLHTAKEKSE